MILRLQSEPQQSKAGRSCRCDGKNFAFLNPSDSGAVLRLGFCLSFPIQASAVALVPLCVMFISKCLYHILWDVCHMTSSMTNETACFLKV